MTIIRRIDKVSTLTGECISVIETGNPKGLDCIAWGAVEYTVEIAASGTIMIDSFVGTAKGIVVIICAGRTSIARVQIIEVSAAKGCCV